MSVAESRWAGSRHLVSRQDKVGRVPASERAFEIIASLLLLAFFAPVMLLIAALVWLQDGGPVFFSQWRIGHGGTRFRCMKFRSMHVSAEQRLHAFLSKDEGAYAEWLSAQKLRRDPRVTPLGHILRKSSLDELPQLFNVLKGEMSLVGPRPIVQAEVARYGRRFRYYCAVRPGITGLWQVSGRNNTSYARRVACDVAFVRRRSARLYASILLRTVPAVLVRQGAF